MHRSSSSSAKGRRPSSKPSAVQEIDYKDVETLRQFVTERGKILPRRITGVTATQQRNITKAIKRARCIALMPFVATDM